MITATLIASLLAPLRRILPGLLLCLAVTGAALALESAEEHLFGRAWLEALVLAIVLGTALRTAWNPGARFFPRIASAPRRSSKSPSSCSALRSASQPCWRPDPAFSSASPWW